MKISGELKYFPKSIANKAIFVYFLLLILLAVIFPSYMITLEGCLFGLFFVIFFFVLSSNLTFKWSNLDEKIFVKKVFWLALILRLIWVVFSYYYFIWMTGKPFMYGAADAIGYDGEARWINALYNADMMHVYFLDYLKGGYSDAGFPLYISFFYYFSDSSIILIRIVNALLGAWSVILVYKLSIRNFGEKTAKIAAIITAVMPILIFYCGLHLKEVIMTFLLVFFIERADYFLYAKAPKNLLTFVFTVVLGFALFCFRTVLAAVAFLSFFINTVFSSNSKIKNSKKVIFIILIIFVGLYFLKTKFKNEVGQYYSDKGTNLQKKMVSYSRGNKLAKYGKASVFMPVILIAPFPTIVDVGQKKLQIVSGALYIRNILAFFTLLGIIYIFKRKILRNHLLILGILCGYLIVLANSGFALSERFHYPIIPFIIILAAFGITKFRSAHRKYFSLYLCFIFLLIVGWNVFKLGGRGLI